MTGGNCPETPRQKMIGMMYLFYTALLALNVSGEILNAFVLVNDSLEVTTESFYNKTEGLYAKLGALNAQQPEKYEPIFKEALVVKSRTNKLIKQIERYKQEIIAKGDGDAYDPKNPKSVHDIKKKDNLNAAPELMTGTGGPMKGDSLKTVLDDYRKFMLNHIEDTSFAIYGNIQTALSTKDDFSDPENKKTWKGKIFENMPLVGTIAMMTKLQTDIRNTEADIIERMIVGVDEDLITITNVEALVSSNASYIVKGGTYEAQVFIGARDTSMKPTVYFSNQYPFYDTIKEDGKVTYKMRGTMGAEYDTLPIIEGKGIYSIENAQNIGTHSWGGLISWKTKQGEKMLPFMNEYMIGETGFAISPTGVNVFYRGIDNPVEVSVSGYPKEKVRAYMSGGGSLVPRAGSYVARITSPSTRDVTISVSVETEAGTKSLGSKKFRVLNVPVPPAKLNGTKGEGRVHKNDVMSGQLMADLADQFFPFQVKFDVISFRFTYKVRGQTNSITVYGNRLNTEAQAALQGLGRGTRVSFESIQVKGPSGTFQTAPVSLELR
ncbi:MAG: gliding motility protein GldM [Bacteroidales bacterium]|jgi:gliding motility-associated protein GldM|nr:gliding motility protein GldM [Bacteroidales bacterium]